jgi:carboxylesterase type B
MLNTSFPFCLLFAADGTGYLSQNPLASFQQSQVNDVPIIIGTVKNEGNLFINFAFNSSLGETKYIAVIEIMIGLVHGAEVMAQYPLPNPVPTDLRPHLGDVATDALFVCPTRNATASLASSPTRKSPIYLYSYQHVESFNQAVWGTAAPFPFCWPIVCHGAELVELFHPNYPQYGTNYTADENALSVTMQTFWSNLAASGKSPNGPAAPTVQWTPYNLSGRPTMLLQAGEVGLMNDYNAVNCDFFDNVVGYNYY